MSSNMTLVVKMTIAEPFLNEVTDELVKLQQSTLRLDKGCIQYDLHKVINSKNSFTLIEKWQDAKSLEKHKEKEHFKNFIQNTSGKIENYEASILNQLIK